MSVALHIDTRDLGNAKVVENRHRTSVHLREFVDSGDRYLSADVTLYCRDRQEAGEIAEAINRATERGKRHRVSGPFEEAA